MRIWGILAAVAIAMMTMPAVAELADIGRLAARHSWLPWPEEKEVADHPLKPVVRSVLAGERGKQPDWKLPMVVNGLRKEPQQCMITAYCSKCCDGGGRYTRWGSPVRRGICAADPDYWGPGSVIWIGAPVNEVLIVEDTGGAIQGPHRFDVCMEGAHYMCREIGYSETIYVPLHRVPPKAHWGQKPRGWHPPVWCTPPGEDSGS
ncbi:MAG: 3D domain-containing protein [Armatimonadota bacterium]|nr:3D domain-containing protein [Armatimonadota bacterium]